MKKYKNLTEQDYRGVQAFLAAGIKPGQIRQVTGRTTTTIGAIGKSTDFEDYKTKLRAKYKKPVVPEPTVEQAAHEVQDELMDKLDKIELKLNQITVAVNVLLEEADRQRSHGKVNIWERG